MKTIKLESQIDAYSYVESKCRECFGRGQVRQSIPYQGRWRSAYLMCDCVRRTVLRMAKTNPSIDIEKLLKQLVIEFTRINREKELN